MYAAGAVAEKAMPRSLLASAPAPSVTPANTSLPDLTATQAIAMLCARDVTAVQYVEALFDRYDSGGFECLNAFVSLNRTKVSTAPCRACIHRSSQGLMTPLLTWPGLRNHLSASRTKSTLLHNLNMT